MELLSIDRVRADLAAHQARQDFLIKSQRRSAEYIAAHVKRGMAAANTQDISNLREGSDCTDQELNAALARFARAYMTKSDMVGAQAELAGALLKGFAREAESAWAELDQECF